MKKVIRIVAVCVFMCFLIVNTYDYNLVNEGNIPLSEGKYIVKSDFDVNEIPDKNNTGVVASEDDLEEVVGEKSYSGVFFRNSGTGLIKLEFVYTNKTVAGTIEFKNLDFSKNKVQLLNEASVDRKINLKFTNCKFGYFSCSKALSNISYEFNNCELMHFDGSNAAFDKCKFGGSYNDAINPFVNVSVNNSYFKDMSYELSSGTVHTDGTQIYGADGIDVSNINFYNCRFELPQLVMPNRNAYINACIMLQLEKSNGSDISFKNCYLNGGGYSIYAWSKNENYELKDTQFENIKVGCLSKYGKLYNRVSEYVEFKDVDYTSNMYISSVERDKDKNSTVLYATNDTNKEKEFIVLTSNGNKYSYKIDACPKYEEVSEGMKFEDFPFDVEYVIPEYCDWIVCYELKDGEYTSVSDLKQIRYVNWTDSDVLVTDVNNTLLGKESLPDNEVETDGSQDLPAEDSSQDDSIVDSGVCGSDVSWTLSKDGELTLEGSGKTYNYYSKSSAPWYDEKDEIKEVIIDEGISSIGNQLFRNLDKIEEVDIPESVDTIGKNAFIGCSSLESVSITNTIKEIGENSFQSTALKTVYYTGTSEEWENVTISGNNNKLNQAEVVIKSKEIANGQCGSNISWILYEDGMLELSGTGSTYNYSSKSVSPFLELSSQISYVKICSGVECIGTQVFRNCTQVKRVDFPKTLSKIGNNAFIGCKNITDVNYEGSDEEWQNISIGSYNTSITNRINTN